MIRICLIIGFFSCFGCGSTAQDSKPTDPSPSEEPPAPGPNNPEPSEEAHTHHEEDKTIKPYLVREDIQAGMNSVAADVKACGKGYGAITVRIIIAPTGQVVQAEALAAYAETEIGTCVENALSKIEFPESSQSLTVRYPFEF